MLINATSSHGILTFMDGYSGYNQIFVTKFDNYKTTFKCLSAQWVYEWIVTPFNLKNTSVTYQNAIRAMKAIFHDLISKNMEAYINDVVVKSVIWINTLLIWSNHLLEWGFITWKWTLPSVGNFLGFLVHHQGIEVDKNKAKVILKARPP